LGVEKPSIKAVAAKWPKAKAPEAFWPVFESQKGGALTTSAMGQMIADLVKAAGHLVPEETSAHTLRHTFARWYLAQYPGDLVGLATLLGHRVNVIIGCRSFLTIICRKQSTFQAGKGTEYDT
jgi:integrase